MRSSIEVYRIGNIYITYLLLTFSSSPFAYVDPLHCNMAYLYLELLKDSLNEYAYAAELADLNYALQNTIYGMYVSTNIKKTLKSLKFTSMNQETIWFAGSIFKMIFPIEDLILKFLFQPWFLISHNLNFTWNILSLQDSHSYSDFSFHFISFIKIMKLNEI